jgi:hypothetical protein
VPDTHCDLQAIAASKLRTVRQIDLLALCAQADCLTEKLANCLLLVGLQFGEKLAALEEIAINAPANG